MMRVPFIAAAVLLALAACSSSPEPINASAAGVTYRYSGDHIHEATRDAAAHCGTYGKRATLTNISQQSGDSLAIFECS